MYGTSSGNNTNEEIENRLHKLKILSTEEISINDKFKTAEDNKNAGDLINLVRINNQAYNSLAVLRKDMLDKTLVINGANVKITEHIKKND